MGHLGWECLCVYVLCVLGCGVRVCAGELLLVGAHWGGGRMRSIPVHWSLVGIRRIGDMMAGRWLCDQPGSVGLCSDDDVH